MICIVSNLGGRGCFLQYNKEGRKAMTAMITLLYQKIFRRFGTVTLVAAIALLSLAVSVQAAQLTVSESVSASRQAAALAFWTRARIAAAPALALPVDRSAGGIDAAVLYEPEVIGPGSSSPPGAADPNAARIAQAVFWQDWVAWKRKRNPRWMNPRWRNQPTTMAGTPVSTHSTMSIRIPRSGISFRISGMASSPSPRPAAAPHVRRR